MNKIIKNSFILYLVCVLLNSCTTKPISFILNISNELIETGPGNYTGEVILTSNYKWSIESDLPEWLSVNPSSGDGGSSVVKIDIKINELDKERFHIISIRAGDIEKKISVHQEAATIFLITDTIIECSEYGALVEIPVKTNKSCSMTIDGGGGWIELQPTKALSEIKYSLLIAPLSMDIEREAKVIFSDNYNIPIDTVILRQSTKRLKLKRILSVIYKSTNGDNWRNNTNWNSEKPFREWYGLETNGVDVVKIDLSNNNLKGTIPVEISGLTELTSLKLWSNELGGELPSSISKLYKLKELIISNNHFEEKFPDELYQLRELETLSLSNNKFVFDLKKACIGMTKLKELALDNIQINSTIPTEIALLSDLQLLSMRFCGLYGNIPSQLWSLYSIKHLALDNNELSGEISPMIADLKNLKILGLGANNLSGKIPVQIATLKKLEYLQLFFNYFHGPLPLSLKNLPNWKNISNENNIYQQKDGLFLSHEGFVIGDLYYNDNNTNPVGVVYRLDNKIGIPLTDQSGSSEYCSVVYGISNKTLWSLEYSDTPSDNLSDGLYNCAALENYVKTQNTLLANFPALKWCLSINKLSGLSDSFIEMKTVENSKMWYIPAPYETIEIFANIDIINSMLKLAEISQGFKTQQYISSYDGDFLNKYAVSIVDKLSTDITYKDKKEICDILLIKKIR